MLHTKYAKQQHIDRDRLPNGCRETAVDAPRNRDVAQETDRINKSGKADEITRCAVNDGEKALHRDLRILIELEGMQRGSELGGVTSAGSECRSCAA